MSNLGGDPWDYISYYEEKKRQNKPKQMFVIRPIRDISDELKLQIDSIIESYQADGYKIYDPLTMTNQKDKYGLRICEDNRQAIRDSDVVLFLWDGKSQGCLFDLGMAFALMKPIRIDERALPPKTDHKSFQNMIRRHQKLYG